MKFNQWVRQQRLAKGLQVSECAKRAHVKQPTWSQWELETNEPRVATVRKISFALQVDFYEALRYAFDPEFGNEGVGQESSDEDKLLLQALSGLGSTDKKMLLDLVAHFKTRSDSQEIPYPRMIEPPSEHSVTHYSHQTLKIDLTNGYVYDPKGSLVGEDRILEVGDLLGQLAIMYMKSKYSSLDLEPILTYIRQNFPMPELADASVVVTSTTAKANVEI